MANTVKRCNRIFRHIIQHQKKVAGNQKETPIKFKMEVMAGWLLIFPDYTMK